METAFEAAIDADIRAGLEREGFAVDDAKWQAAHQHAVDTFAPSLYRSVIWRLTSGDRDASERVYAWMEDRAHARDLFELRPGIAAVLGVLQKRGLKLGLAANQPIETIERLAYHGIGDYFENQGISGIYGFRKPDVRLFIQACEDLSVTPDECIMAGDRIDNDIVLAKLLGMRTVRIRTGRHTSQEPRFWDETPDAEATDADGILAAIETILDLPGR
jgi:HAD superfamily hydrolase (TIGR01549 family)